MPGVKYYLRQANAFLLLAQSITDAQGALSNDGAAIPQYDIRVGG
jgi:hypothetical protein